jgi:DME family drug/metabolite transporter
MGPGLVLVAVAAVSWGTTGATMATLTGLGDVGPLFVGWARLAVAAPCLVAAALWRREPRATRPPAAAWRPRDGVLMLALGAAMAVYQLCYFRAVTMIGVAVTALLAICSAPLFIAAIAGVALGERVNRRVGTSLVTAVLGTGLLVAGTRDLQGVSGRFAAGAALALGAGLSYAAYAVAAKGLLAERPPLVVAAATFGLGALLLSPALALEPLPAPAVLAAGWPLLLYLGTGPTALAYALFTAGLRRVPATAAGIVTLLEPLTATTLGIVLFGERLGMAGLVGAALLLAALALLSLGR